MKKIVKEILFIAILTLFIMQFSTKVLADDNKNGEIKNFVKATEIEGLISEFATDGKNLYYFNDDNELMMYNKNQNKLKTVTKTNIYKLFDSYKESMIDVELDLRLVGCLNNKVYTVAILGRTFLEENPYKESILISCDLNSTDKHFKRICKIPNNIRADYACFCVYNKKLYAIGGMSKSVYSFNTKMEIWKTEENLPEDEYLGEAYQIGDKLIYLEGSLYGKLYEFDPIEGEWKKIGSGLSIYEIAPVWDGFLKMRHDGNLIYTVRKSVLNNKVASVNNDYKVCSNGLIMQLFTLDDAIFACSNYRNEMTFLEYLPIQGIKSNSWIGEYKNKRVAEDYYFDADIKFLNQTKYTIDFDLNVLYGKSINSVSKGRVRGTARLVNSNTNQDKGNTVRDTYWFKERVYGTIHEFLFTFHTNGTSEWVEIKKECEGEDEKCYHYVDDDKEVSFDGKYTKIVPNKVENLKSSTAKTNSLTLTWNKSKNADGYSVYMYDSASKKYKCLGNTSKNTYTVKNLKEAKTYKFKVRAYKTVDGSKTYGKYSSVLTTGTTTKAIKLLKLVPDKKSFFVAWEKISGATGYEVYLATSANGKYTKKTNTTKNIIKIKGLKAKSKYYVKIRTYRTVNGKKIYSPYSSYKTVKTK